MREETPPLNPGQETDVTKEVEDGMKDTDGVFGELGRELGTKPLTPEERVAAQEWQNKGKEGE